MNQVKEERKPISWDATILAEFLREIRDELRELNNKQPNIFERVFSRLYWQVRRKDS